MNEKTSLTAYVTGFIASAVFITAAYLLVVFNNSQHFLSMLSLIILIFTLAFVQALVQLLCFMHVGFGSGSRMRTSILLFTVVGVGIMVTGSLWIMYHLNYNMTPSQMTSTIFQEEGVQMPNK